MAFVAPFDLVGGALVVLVASGGAGLLPSASSRRATVGALSLALLGCLLLVAVALEVLLGGAAGTITVALPGFQSASNALSLAIVLGPLQGLFLLLVGAVGGAITLASVGYVPAYVHERPATLAGIYGLFVGSMALLVLSGTAFLFLVAWEGMTLLSYVMVVHEHGSWDVRRAGLTYLVMSHAAAAALLAGFVVLYVGTGSTNFAAMSAEARALPELTRDAVFVAMVLGFGTKAGVVPLHVWLPEAHPAAPSNVSSIMSGIMIKMGVFGLLLVVFEVLGGGPLWWGFVLLVLGAASALLGVLNAIAQHDVKRLLAFSSVENIGIIFMALGTALVFLSLGWPALAAVALLAAILHTFNHAMFKGLLFLGAGAVVGTTGTRDMEQMGGLARGMPRTAIAFLFGAMAISALPPLNGFVSEWLLFQAFFASFGTGSLATEVAFTAAAGTLALASGLAAYCFVKAFGVIFLARPRSEVARSVRSDAPAAMQGGMIALAGACVAVGVFPVLLLSTFAGTVRTITGASYSTSPWAWGAPLAFPSASGAATPSVPPHGSLAIGVVALLLMVVLLAATVLRRVTSNGSPARRPMWDCGMDAPTPRMEYTASGYAQPILRLFSVFYGAHPVSELGDLGGARPGVLQKTVRHESEVDYPLMEQVYSPIVRLVRELARRVSRLQSGGIHAYLAYMVLTLVVLLVASRLFGGVLP